MYLLLLIFVIAAAVIGYKEIVKKRRRELLAEILEGLHLENIESWLNDYDDQIIVKSRSAQENYSDIKYLKEGNNFNHVKKICDKRREIRSEIDAFFSQKAEMYESQPQYAYVKRQLEAYMNKAEGYNLEIIYITSAGNNKGSYRLHISDKRIGYLSRHPEELMSKAEYSKLLKAEAKDALERRKHYFYGRVNELIDYANDAKGSLTVASRSSVLDSLVQKLYDGTVNKIAKISAPESEEWNIIEKFINVSEADIRKLVEDDRRIADYYRSEDFGRIKDTCRLLTESQKEFNEYIEEKSEAIMQLFGTRTVRNETQCDDTNNYIRAYKKSINPFIAEVSSTVFSSAENSPLDYVIKYFYPNKSQYKSQIEKLSTLIEELETLKEAKEIIEAYKKDYSEYIKGVPDYVMADDEDGFYRRLGLTIIDEGVLNVEYKFIYTSGGGMAQRSFTVPMTEETITELIAKLESSLTQDALHKEQRALMTAKLRTHIKERDHYTCCQCGNSVQAEPNLLLEIDHIIPVAKGGLTEEGNLQTLCWKCNRSKGAKLINAI